MSETGSSTDGATLPGSSRHEGSPCPNCGSLSVHRSHRKGLTERLLAVAGARIRRCHACNVRFARLFNSAVYIDDARRTFRRAALIVLMVAGAAVVLFVMLWLMRKQAAIGPSDCRLETPAYASRPLLPCVSAKWTEPLPSSCARRAP
jgi:hypothetical protein